MTRHPRSFAAGIAVGAAMVLALGATQPAVPAPHTLRPVEIVLHRFDTKPGEKTKLGEWIDFLHARHRDAVATLARERTYLEAMFTAREEPHRLYWLTVQGAGGAPVESSILDLDVHHMAYMDAVIARGSHRRCATRNVLAPDFIVRSVAAEQRREQR